MMESPFPNDQHLTNAISAAALVAAPVSMWIEVAPVITVLVGLAGFLWYILLFTKEAIHWYKNYRRKHPK